MKRTLMIITMLAVLVILPLALAGCSCGGGATLTENDIAIIRADHTKLTGFGTRLDDAEGDIADVRGVTDKLDDETLATLVALAALDAETLERLVGLEEDELEALLNLKEWQDDLQNPDKDGSLADIEARLEDLENSQPDGNGGNGGSNPDGELVVTIDVEDPPYTFTTGSTAATMVAPVRVTNGTDGYYEVMFNVTLRCVTSDYEAEVTGVPTMDVNGVGMAGTPVSSWAECRYVYFVWTSPDAILVAPGQTAVVYLYLNSFATATNEVWEATLADITMTEL